MPWRVTPAWLETCRALLCGWPRFARTSGAMCGVVAKGTATCRETGRSSPHRLPVVAESQPRSTGATAEMTTGHLLTSTWDWEPSVLAGCAALAVGYVVVARPLGVRAMLSFLSGVLA